jgi:hypothetical protein
MEDRQGPEDVKETQDWEKQKKEEPKWVDQKKEDPKETEEWEKQKGKK